MIEHISIVMPSMRPDLLIRCIASLELYSRYSHEIIIMQDTHGAFKDTWNNFKLPDAGLLGNWKNPLFHKEYKHDIKFFTSTRYQELPLTSKYKERGFFTGKSVEPAACAATEGVPLCKYDWIAMPPDDDFFYLPDWDYHLLKHINPDDKKIIYNVKQLCPREINASTHRNSWIGFEHPNGSTEYKLRYSVPLRISYALEQTKEYRKDEAHITPMLSSEYGFNNPLIVHKDTILGAGGKATLLESADALWGNIDAMWTSLRGFDAYGCKKCCVQNSNLIHYPGCLIDDLQDPPIRWMGLPFKINEEQDGYD